MLQACFDICFLCQKPNNYLLNRIEEKKGKKKASVRNLK